MKAVVLFGPGVSAQAKQMLTGELGKLSPMFRVVEDSSGVSLVPSGRQQGDEEGLTAEWNTLLQGISGIDTDGVCVRHSVNEMGVPYFTAGPNCSK